MISKRQYAYEKGVSCCTPWERAWMSTCRRANHFKLPKTSFKKKMEDCFVDGMSWDNYGEWEVDHIVPLSKGGKHSPQNLQPLWRSDNRRKSNF